MSLLKATFANGFTWVYDPNVHAAATHYSDGTADHPLVSSVSVPDDTPLGFTDPNAAPPKPSEAEPASASS